MKKIVFLAAVAAMVAGCCGKHDSKPVQDPVEYVNILGGTASTYELSTGNTYPAVAVPWGMNFWTPQTGKNGDGWTYRYDATRIRGLKQTHQPSPWINDYGEFSIMPVTTGPVWDEEQRQSWFSHKAETAKPYYYSVYLAEHDVVAELPPTSRAAAVRLTYPEKEISYLVVDAYQRGSSVSIDVNNSTITGYTTMNHGGVSENFRNWFVIKSDTPFQTVSTVADGKLSLQLYQRSADTFLGVPFNIASYALLLQMMAQVTGLECGDFVHTTGDTHLYLNHLEQAELQLTRTPRPLPKMLINPDVKDIFSFRYEDFELTDYDPWPHIKAEVSV